MAFSETPRLGLPQWSTGNPDGPTRVEFNTAFKRIEDRVVAYDGSVNRSAAGVKARFHVASDGSMSWDTGAAWVPVGSVIKGVSGAAAAAAPVARFVGGATSSNDLLAVADAANVNRVRVNAAGDLIAGQTGVYAVQSSADAPQIRSDLRAGSGGTLVQKVSGTADQTADLTEWFKGNTVVARTGANGDFWLLGGLTTQGINVVDAIGVRAINVGQDIGVGRDAVVQRNLVVNGAIGGPTISTILNLLGGGGLRVDTFDPSVGPGPRGVGFYITNYNLFGGYGSIVTISWGGALGLQIWCNYGVGNSNDPGWCGFAMRTWNPDASGNWGRWWRGGV